MPEGGTAITIGVFDGVHLGHQHLFSQVKAVAQSLGCQSGAVCFRNNPLEVLQPGIKLAYLSTMEQRVQLIKEAGIQIVCPITFTLEVRNLSPLQFVTLLKERLGMKALVVGPDFALGKNRAGNIPVLTEIGRELGYGVAVASPFTLEGQVVSSTRVRQALKDGDVAAARRLLGRPYAVTGVVERGKGRGAGLGFPTANISYPESQILPSNGIYAAWAVFERQRYKAAVSIGMNPTFMDVNKPSLEAHVLDFQRDIYGMSLTLEFERRLRDEAKFDTLEALKRQISADVEQVRTLLA